MKQHTSQEGQASRRGMAGVLGIIILLTGWYLLADRMTPYTTQARIQAFIIPVSPEVSGRIQRIYVSDNQKVATGDILFEIDPEPYDIALAKAQADFETVVNSVSASNDAIDVVRAKWYAAKTTWENAAKDAERQERLYREDPGTISVRRLEIAQATRDTAKSQLSAAKAELQQMMEATGETDEKNTQLRSARAAVQKAELDRSNTRVTVNNRGIITDLRTTTGQFTGAGTPVMTLVALHDVWVSADMTENNIGNVEAGDEVEILLDSMPGHIFRGKVHSTSFGVSSTSSQPPGTLPTVNNDRDWLRQAQRFPVKILFDKDNTPPVDKLRVGGQADVLIYTSEHNVMNLSGALYIRLMSLLSYIY
ncbi:HlyD family secretion protein [Enterobacter mori]|uniref:HlyD family secretion protein n=1 Tax=Enterobacter mori TaxID=539813 RepID=UPI003B83F89C